jgi:hypothetical protein
MHTLLAAVTIVKFIGLCTFTGRLPKEPGVHVILPRIPVSSGIEQHVPLLAYERKGCVSATNCPGSALHDMPGYNYVSLNGDRVGFTVIGKNSPLAESDIPPLPRLGTCCPKMGALTRAFQGPSFPGAAAIVDLPTGHLDSCGTHPLSGTADYRVDTVLTLQHSSKTMSISLTRNGTTTTIALRAGTPIVIENLPKAWVMLDHTQYHQTGSAHDNAYYAMGDGSGANQTCASLQSCSPAVQQCADDPALWGQRQGNNTTATASSECSNSQWP